MTSVTLSFTSLTRLRLELRFISTCVCALCVGMCVNIHVCVLYAYILNTELCFFTLYFMGLMGIKVRYIFFELNYREVIYFYENLEKFAGPYTIY